MSCYICKNFNPWSLQTGIYGILGSPRPQNQDKAKGLAACNSQTASPFGCLNNLCSCFYLTFCGHFSLEGSGFSCPHPASTVSESALMHMWKNTGGQIERVCS